MLGYTLDAIQDCRFRAAADVTAELGEGWEHRRCHPVCPKLAPPAQEQHCSEAHHETPYAEHHNGVHFTILFLAMCLTVGALSALCIPKWIPYTVTILMLGIFVGIAAFFAETAPTCPMNALYKYDRDGDERVSRTEWKEFTCEGCHPESVCLLDSDRSCGDGSADLPAESSDGLDLPFDLSVASSVNHTAGDGYSHR